MIRSTPQVASLDAAYATCRDLHRRHGRSYYLATRLLPPWKRRHVHALYGFTRYTDDIVDVEGTPSSEPERTRRLAQWAAQFRAVVDGATVGYFGQLHPEEAERRKLKQAVLLGEIYLDRLYRQNLRQAAPRELSRFQPVRRDFSLLFPGTVRWAQVSEAIGALGIPELASFTPKEVLRDAKGQRVPEGHVSMLVGTVFQSNKGTLREEELQTFSQQIVGAMESLGGKLRS